MNHARRWLVTGALGGFLTVALGAFGAHVVAKHVNADMFAIWQTATHYLAIHALALIGCGLLLLMRPRTPWINSAGWSFASGALLFSGSLFALALSGIRILGIITPIGGVLFLVGWILLALGAWQATSTASDGTP